MKQFKLTQLALLIGCSALMSGCAVDRVVTNMNEADYVSQDASRMLNSMQKITPRNQSFTVLHDRYWVQKTPIKTSESRLRDQYPELDCEITFSPSSGMSLHEFSESVSRLCGVPVRIMSDASLLIQGSSGDGGAMMAGGALPPLPNLPGLGGSPMGSVGGSNTASTSNAGSYSAAGRKIKLQYQGPLSGLLENVTSSLGLSWRQSTTGVEIYYLDTRTFTMMTLPSTTETMSRVESTSSTSSGGGDSSLSGSSGSNQSTSTTIKNDLLVDIQRNIENMLTVGVGRMSLSPSTGAVTVTDTPQNLEKINKYINRENKVITQQVTLKVELFSVTLRGEDSMSLDWDLVYDRLGSQGLSLNSSSPSIQNGVNAGFSVGGSSRFANSKLLIQALSEQGKVSVVTNTTVNTTNLQPAPVQVSRQISYLASSETTTTTDVGVSTSLTPATVTVGFSMTLLPYIFPDSDDILLQYNVNLSDLIRLNEVKSGDSTIQTPEIDSRIFSQRVKVRANETLIVGGFEQTSNEGTARGVGSAFNPFFGGGMTGKKERTVIVVAITPTLVDG